MGPFTWILHVKHTLKNFGKFEFFPKFIHNSPKMVGGTLYTYPDNFRAQKVLIAAEYSGAKVKLASNFVFGETNTTKEFLAKFPNGKVPAFESDNGMCLFESNAIAYYVANDQLRGGKDPVAQAQVLQWLNFADSDILPAACTWVFPTLGIMQFNKGSWDMDDFKRFYSNNDEDKSVPYFWEKFDKENYSIWRCDYKYNDELTMVFMSCNLMSGMFQRLEKLRKNAFASMALFGENNNSSISGIWVWRGHS